MNQLIETLFEFSLLAFLAEELWISLRDHWRQITPVNTIGQSQFAILVVVAFILGGITRRMGLLPMTSQTSIPLLIGMVVIWCGLALRMWSVLTLGRFFRITLTIQESHHVITNGPYKYLRHPSYSGLLLVIVGLSIGLGDWLSFATIVVFCTLALYQRIVAEDRLLIGALGSEYEEYAKHTKRLIPFIY